MKHQPTHTEYLWQKEDLSISSRNDATFYGKITYTRWLSYYWQMYFISLCKPETVLEIGIGNEVISLIGKKMGYRVTTCDIAANLLPDVAADIRNLPFKDGSFELVVCFEVLEHIEYQYFVPCLRSLYDISRQYVVLSLPQRRKYLFTKLHLPWMRRGAFHQVFHDFARHPRDIRPAVRSHFWEIDIRDYPLRRIVHDIEEAGFTIRVDTSVPENIFHRFFLLEK